MKTKKDKQKKKRKRSSSPNKLNSKKKSSNQNNRINKPVISQPRLHKKKNLVHNRSKQNSKIK